MKEILKYLDSVNDPRQEWKVVHNLKDIVIIVLFGTLANADDWHEIAIFAETHETLLRQYIELRNGIPSHDTIQRVMACIRPEVLQGLQQMWNEMLSRNEGEKLKALLSIDGKAMRGSGNKNHDALHVVSAWAKDSGVCFGQEAVIGKGREIAAIENLLDCISVRNQIVRIDAIGTQTEIARKIKQGKGDYLLAVKKNQPNLYENIALYFGDSDHLRQIKAQSTYLKTREKARGQIETREYYQTSDIRWLHQKEKWQGLKSIGMVKTHCKSDTHESTEIRYYICSFLPDAELFAHCVRGHWAVESMHWHLDVTFREDSNRTLERNAAVNLNIIRKLALSILKFFELKRKYSLKKKRFALSCNFALYAEQLLNL